jgi:hypothetical protein
VHDMTHTAAAWHGAIQHSCCVHKVWCLPACLP